MKQSIFILLFCWTTVLSAQIDVDAYLDSTAIMVGDQLRMHLKVEYDPTSVQVDFPNFTNLGEKFEVIGVGAIDSSEQASLRTIQQSLMITSFDSGTQVIPPFPVSYAHNNIKDTIYTSPLYLEVRLPQIDSLIAPIYDILEEELSFEEDVLPFLWKGGLLLLLGLFFYYIAKRYQKDPKPIAAIEIQRPAHEIAFERLQTLETAQLWQKGDIKPYQSQLTYIMREYLENRFKVNALESTTDEIIDDLQKVEISDTDKSRIRTVLQTADLVKFAKVIPPMKVHQEGMDVTRVFVETTQFVPEPEAEETTTEGESTIDNGDDPVVQPS